MTAPVRRCLVSLTTAALVASALPVLAQAGAGAWPHPYGEGQRRAGTALGPADPGRRWQAAIPEAAVYPRPPQEGLPGFAPVLDGAGHLLVLVDPPDPDLSKDARGSELVALRTTDGSVAWRLGGLTPFCHPAVAGDGTVWVTQSLQPGGYPDYYQPPPAALVGLDATTGAVRARWDGGTEGPDRLVHCAGAIALTSTGTVVLRELGFEGRLRAFDAASAQPLWASDASAGTPPGQRSMLDHWVLPAPAGVAAAGDVYTGRIRTRDDGTPQETDVVRVSGETGAVEAALTVPDQMFSWPAAQAVLPDGDLLVSTRFPADSGDFDAGSLTRVSDDGVLRIVWTVSSERRSRTAIHQAVDELAVVGDHVVVGTSFGPVFALAASSGELRWGYGVPGGGRAWSLRLDAEANLYHLIWSPEDGDQLVSVDRDGTTRWRVRLTDVGRPAGLGPLAPDGTLYVGAWVPGQDPYAGAPLAVHALDSSGGLAEPPPPPPPVPQGVSRLGEEAADATELAIALSRAVFADGSARRVLLTRNDVFADALAGAPLAGDSAPILFTAGGPDAPLDPRTAAEIRRVLPRGGLVQILGGRNAVSETAVQALGDWVTQRFDGPTRYETAASVMFEVRSRDPDVFADSALVVSGENWPDAVTAGAYGAATRTPVLLTPREFLHPATEQALAQWDVRRTFVVGGRAAVSDQVVAQLPAPERVAGSNRMGTAAAVAAQLWATQSETVVVADLERGDGWIPTLAAAALSARLAAPQLGVGANRYPDETRGYVAGRPVARAVVLGGPTFVSDAVLAALRDDVADG